MTTKPTLGSNHATGTVLTSTEWNRDVLQQGNYTQELVAGTNADKIPASALTNPLTPIPELRSAGTAGTDALRFYEVTRALYIDIGVNGGTQQDLIVRTATGVELLRVAGPTGKLTGLGFFDSGEFTLTAGASTTVVPSFPATQVGPRFVHGLFGIASANNTSPISHTTTATTTVRFTFIQSNAITVNNGTGSTQFCRVWAIW